MRKVTASAIALATFIAGGLLGYVVSREFSHMNATTDELASVDHMNAYVMIQRFQGTPQTYETALRDFLVSLDQRERAPPGLFSRQVVTSDKALTYIRLALLASERNDPSAAAKYRAEAEVMCTQARWKSCSWDELAAMVRRIDEQSVWNPSRPASEHGS